MYTATPLFRSTRTTYFLEQFLFLVPEGKNKKTTVEPLFFFINHFYLNAQFRSKRITAFRSDRKIRIHNEKCNHSNGKPAITCTLL